SSLVKRLPSGESFHDTPARPGRERNGTVRMRRDMLVTSVCQQPTVGAIHESSHGTMWSDPLTVTVILIVTVIRNPRRNLAGLPVLLAADRPASFAPQAQLRLPCRL